MKIQSDSSVCEIVPEDGLIVTRWSVAGVEILHPDGWIESAGKRKRRGGIPILFPQAGSLAESKPGFNLSQHGFARDLPWEVVRAAPDAGEFRLASSAETRKKFPFDFELIARVSVEPSSLTYRLTIRNPMREPLWAAPGVHPYFAIPPSARSGVRTNIPGFDLNSYTLDQSIILPLQQVDVTIPGRGKISMIPSEGFLRPPAKLVVWGDVPDYMCFEPWAAGVGSLYREEERDEVGPSKDKIYTMRLAVE